MATQKKENLDVGRALANLKWDSENALTSLEKVYDFAYQEGVETEAWYWRKTAEKKRWAMTLRVVAILSVTIAGIIPILSPIFKNASGDPWINPIWSSVAIAIGTAAIGLDKFFGFSSGWIRYVTSALNVKSWLLEFTYDWESNRAVMTSPKRAADMDENAQLQIMISKCCAFAVKISNAVQEETKQWANEFQSSISTLDQTLKQQASTGESSAVIINVENGDKATSGWEVEINGRKSGKHFGKTGVLPSMYPGLYQIAVSGCVGKGKKVLHAEAASRVIAGEITNLNLKLT